MPPADDLGELGHMTNLQSRRGAWVAGLLWLVLPVMSAATEPAADAFMATARRAGFRVLEGERLVLVKTGPLVQAME